MITVENTIPHQTPPNRIPAEVNDQIDQHIRSFPSKSSHYSRKDNHNKRYLSEELSVAKMYRLYLEKKNEPVVYAELEFGGNAQPIVKYEYYNNRFKNHHNLSFGRPRSDTRPTCETFELKIKEACDPTVKAELLESERELHHPKAETFYSSLQQHTALAKEDSTVATL